MPHKCTIQSSLTGMVSVALEKRSAPIDEEELHRFLRGGLAAK